MSNDAISWRPPAGGSVPLTDHQLSQIGLLAVMEASAKSSAAAALRALEALSLEDWRRLERVQFSQIMKRLFVASAGLDDELTKRINNLEVAREIGQDMRHAILHATWGQPAAEDIAISYDFNRKLNLDADYIGKALLSCAELKRSSHWNTSRRGIGCAGHPCRTPCWPGYEYQNGNAVSATLVTQQSLQA